MTDDTKDPQLDLFLKNWKMNQGSRPTENKTEPTSAVTELMKLLREFQDKHALGGCEEALLYLELFGSCATASNATVRAECHGVLEMYLALWLPPPPKARLLSTVPKARLLPPPPSNHSRAKPRVTRFGT